MSALGKAKKPEAIFSMAEREEAIRAATDIRRWTDGFNPAPWRVHRLAQALLESWDRIVLKGEPLPDSVMSKLVGELFHTAGPMGRRGPNVSPNVVKPATTLPDTRAMPATVNIPAGV